ncbi:hypothetical protein GCK72_014480 [Caenorhabditis remanei]|uniref:SCP domain-containing protein n=1 Tax=Caenorhabditis remanei TaxID=31234 RepID=A0A6A5GUH5_CAERE|nr:hypothetical protein GCK72_014480 [Caenorhabditis remanei]KAF1758022.1 hypothetical protein GCK72_014480 [Caenorhabditis remanei]
MNSLFIILTCMTGVYSQFTAIGQQEIVDAHNKLRSSLAKGTYVAKGTKQPSATNMKKMGTVASAAWEKEFQDYGLNSLTMDNALFNSGIGHATQMAWANSNLIGCGVKNCGPDSTMNNMNRISVVCQYKAPMPPKKKAKQLTEQQKLRRAYNRQRSFGSTAVVVQDSRKLQLFASFGENPDFNFKKKKAAPAPRKVFPPSPNISVEAVSSDEEDAGNFKIPEAGDDEEEELRKLRAEHNSCELSSLDAFDDDGDQVDFVNGRLVKRLKQPDPAWRPGVREDYVGNYPMQNRPAKKIKHDYKKKDTNRLIKQIVSKPALALNFHQSLCRTLQAAKAKQVKSKLILS